MYFFLASSEIESLGSFVKVRLTNYNKSTELLEMHSKKVYNLRAMYMAYAFRTSHVNPQPRINIRLTDINSRNHKFNSQNMSLLVQGEELLFKVITKIRLISQSSLKQIRETL